MRRVATALVMVFTFAFFSPFQIPARAVSAGVGVVTSGLMMYYDPANPSGVSGSTLTDLSGSGYGGTITSNLSSTPTLTYTNGTFLSFDAGGGYVSLPSISKGSAWTDLTITFYANFGGVNNFERIMDFGNGSGSDNIEIGRDYNTNALFFEAWEGSTSGGYCRSGTGSVNTNTTGNGVIGSNTWNQWAITVSINTSTHTGTCTVYKDNIQVNQVSYGRLPANVTLSRNYIGKSNWSDPYFEGGISDIAIYNRVLSSTELTQNYNAEIDITSPTYSGASNFTANENQTSVATLTASEVVTVLPQTGSMDTNKFNTSGMTVTFASAPNYEANGSVNSNNRYYYYFILMDSNGNTSSTYAIYVDVLNVAEYSSLSPPTLSASPYKGVLVTITVTPTVAAGSLAGKVSYFVAGKRIPGCYKKTFSSGNSTCNWKPPSMGLEEITVTYTPTNTEYAASTVKKSFQVIKRTTSR